MAKTKEQKKQILKDLKEDLKKQKALVLVDFTGLSASDILDLREKLKKRQCLLKVTKKTLFQKAIQHQKNKALEILGKKVNEIKTPLALVFSFEDLVSAARVCYQFSQSNENLTILAGLLDNEVLTKEKVVKLATLPSKEELLGKVVGALTAPYFNFVFVLEANIKKLIFALNAIKGQKNK